MAKKLTNQEFLDKLKNINPNVEPLDEYKNSRTKIKFKCLIDGYEWIMTPRDLIYGGQNCPRCSKNEKYTTQSFKEKLYTINSNILILGEYKGSKIKIKCRCLIDGYEWETTPNGLLDGHGCHMCSGNNKYTTESFKERLYAVNKNIEVMGEYKNSKTKLKCKCVLDNYEWYTTPNSLLLGQGCPQCARHRMSGELHPMYNPDITDDERLYGRRIDGYKEFIINTMKRDDYTCKCCKRSISDKMVVHHLNGYNWFKEGRTDINNAITLCEECHKEFHSIYGYGNNTREQFIIWYITKMIKTA